MNSFFIAISVAYGLLILAFCACLVTSVVADKKKRKNTEKEKIKKN